MGAMELEVQRERRAEMLREAAGRHAARSRRVKIRRGRTRGLWKLASAWVIGR